MLLYKQKKNQGPKGNRLLVSITVLGSAGPIRFVVNEEDLVSDVINTALKAYAREGRFPALGSDTDDFLLHCPSVRPDALNPYETIGSQGARNFVLCNKPRTEGMEDGGRTSRAMSRKGTGNWKAWIHKSLSIKIYSH
ncbi:putative ADP-ribosylation factor GTPase-activating protein AGD11-like [Hibiscus syriacus]|uniref:ADP-ribosylation factor GTPase-activating protein AGD11-like n=1 Tax=Hibiscus syriacus TaxID=106335 RepID=A0A6A3CLT0_HIBSY|nr:putative ADP-ribosylation factor GTPase-activating protein AGD11-like [Hibiscus syriacus]